MLALLKSKIVLIWGGITLALGIAVKYLIARNEALEDRAESAEGQLKFNKNVGIKDTEISNEFSDLEREIAEDRKDGKVPRNLGNPNKF